MFYGFVSLAAYGGAAYGGPSGDAAGGASRTNSGLPRMRLDQNSVLTLPNTGVSLALDLGDNGQVPWTPKSARHGGIHPRNKTEVARRMALAFAATGLDLPGVVATGPVFTSATALAPPPPECNQGCIPKGMKRKAGQPDCCTEGTKTLKCPGPAHYRCGVHALRSNQTAHTATAAATAEAGGGGFRHRSHSHCNLFSQQHRQHRHGCLQQRGWRAADEPHRTVLPGDAGAARAIAQLLDAAASRVLPGGAASKQFGQRGPL